MKCVLVKGTLVIAIAFKNREKLVENACEMHVRDVEGCGARLRRSLPYKYFLNADAPGDTSCTGLAEASIIGFQIIRRPVLHAGGAHAYARLSQFYSMTRE